MVTTLPNHQYRRNQTGVSLMLAILVLAAIMAIAFSLATIVFIEVRSSGDALRTEPTLYGAFGVTEEALFQYKRFYTNSDLNVASCSGQQDTNGVCYFNGVALSLPGSQPIAFDDSPRVEYVPANTTKTIPMFSLVDPTKYYNQVYDSLTLQLLPNSNSLGVKLYYIDSQDVRHDEMDVSLSGSNLLSHTIASPTGQYELQLVNSTSAGASVSISTVRVGNAQPAGLPFVGEQVLRIKADYNGLNRTYQVRIPVP